MVGRARWLWGFFCFFLFCVFVFFFSSWMNFKLIVNTRREEDFVQRRARQNNLGWVLCCWRVR